MKTIVRFLKNYKFSIPAALVLFIIVIFFATRGGSDVKAETVNATRKTVAQEVSVTGRVVPVQALDLSVQSGGRVTTVNAEVGQVVTTGQVLLRVDSADLQVRLGKQRAALEQARLALTSAEDDLTQAYEEGFNTLAESFVDISPIVTEVDNILHDGSYSPYFSTTEVREVNNIAFNTKEAIDDRFYAARNLQKTLVKKYTTFDRNASSEELSIMLNETYAVLKTFSDIVKDVRNLIIYMEDRTDDPIPTEITRDKATLNTYISDINTHLSNVSSVQTTIKNSGKGIGDQSIDVQNSLIDIKQAELDIQDTLVQINNRTITAPFTGIVTEVEAERGETISAGTPVISLISTSQHEIEAFIPEADIAKVTVHADTDVTLDAYGSDVLFKATVISISPSETLVDGVATYKTKLQFVNNDARIKSGMTASLIIKGERKEDVIAIPQRSVITRGNEKYVEVVEGETIVEKKVETGLRGSDGSIEIVSGIAEGERVVVFSEQK